MTLHEDDRDTFEQCEAIAHTTAKRFKLKLKVFEAKRIPIYKTAGICYYEQARIAVVFRYRIKTRAGQRWFSFPEQLEVVLGTVGHELAHLRYPDHGKKFRNFANRIIKHILETYYDPLTLDFKLALIN